MAKVIIVEPDITDEENMRNWEKVNDILNLIADDIEENSKKKKSGMTFKNQCESTK